MLFESPDALVYFQNFNKPSDKLWYRITKATWITLKSTSKRATICFSNPAERFAYVIPVRDIEAQIERSGWERDYLEVNIDHVSSRWVELDWKIERYLKTWRD